ncbi:MAG: TetR/AcrR family transcriptional regulator [Hyphomonadaceae bacterium]|nr:TetR/AcrR family transcriptional regulator [Hyphomonadaceae bacterium]
MPPPRSPTTRASAPRRRKMDPEGKRDAVLGAGEALFASAGYAGATMADIARAADVAVGSVYRLFPDKAALLAALHQRMEDRFIDAILRGWRAGPSPAERFGPMIDALLDEAWAVRDVMPLYTLTRDLIGATAYEPHRRMVDTIARLYREGVAAGAFARHDPAIAAAIAYGMVDGALRVWMKNPTRARRAAVARDLKTLFDRAFLRTGA